MTPARAAGDPGVANERTSLAWQRTALALIAATAILARLTWDDLGLVGLAPLALAMALSLWVFVESWARYSHDAGIRFRSRSRGGRAPLSLALATALIAVTELAALLA